MATIHPIVDEGLGNSAYVVELGDGRALVVDPARDPGPYLAVAGRRGLQIAYVAETHLHADFLTGSRELAAAGAQVLAPRASRLGFGHRGLEDGEEVDLGGLTLRVLATPGHAPEHVSYLLLDAGRPLALLERALQAAGQQPPVAGPQGVPHPGGLHGSNGIAGRSAMTFACSIAARGSGSWRARRRRSSPLRLTSVGAGGQTDRRPVRNW